MITAAIIGHGRSPEKQGWGPKIDTCDIVIRMWDWGWQEEADYGTKYDYGFYEIGYGLAEKVIKFKHRDPDKGWIASILDRRSKILPNSILVDQAPWNRIGMRLGGRGQTGRLQFTRGTIAACWAIEYLTEGDEIILVGFDVIRSGITQSVEDSFSAVYRSNPGTFSFAGWRADQTKFGNHDYAIERPLLEHLAESRGVNLYFAQDIWTDPCSQP